MSSIGKHAALLAIIVLATALLRVTDARAERIVLLQFTGQKASLLREKVAMSLKRAGHRVIRSKASSRGLSTRRLKQVGKKADVVLSGSVESARRGDWSIVLRASNPELDTLGDEISFSGDSLRALGKDLYENAAERVEQEFSRNTPELPPAPEADPEPDTAAATASESTAALAPQGASLDMSDGPLEDDASSTEAAPMERDSGSAENEPREAGTFIRLSARAGFVRRNMDFYEDIYGTLRKQTTSMWVYRALGEVYPFRGGIGRHLGLILSYEGIASGSVRDVDFDVTYPVQFSEVFGGARIRYPVGAHELGLQVTLGQMSSGLDDENGSAKIPDLQYRLLRSSLDARLELGFLSATASAGFRLPLGFGEAAETRWFPHMGGYGVEASVGLSRALSEHVSIDAIGSVRRYLMEMNSEPRDVTEGPSEVAAGAVDRYLAAYLGVSVAL